MPWKEDCHMAAHKHLTFDERTAIQLLLAKKESFKRIALSLNCNCSTISKEIRKHRVQKNSFAVGMLPNRCKSRVSCDIKNICSGCYNKRCSSCRSTRCNLKCQSYEEEICSQLEKPPYVCNGCPKRQRCTLVKYFYDAKISQQNYEYTLSESRSGLSISEEEIKRIDLLLSPRIKQGHSIYAALLEFKDEIMYSEKTIYKLIELNLLSVRNIDLPKKVRYRPRKNKSQEYKVNKKCREGRTYKDFQEYMSLHPDSIVTEGDSVIGTIGGACLLTLTVVDVSFVVAILRERNDSKSVTTIFEEAHQALGQKEFNAIFQVLLLDNGSEFTDPEALERLGVKVFYCEPGRPDQKGTCEKNHVELRKILLKGSSFDSYTQDDMELVMSHVNSYPRKKLNGKSPTQSFKFLYGESLITYFRIEEIPLEEVLLKPQLLHK